MLLKVAVSSRALFNINDGHDIFVSQGGEAFLAYMKKNEKKPLRQGVAFELVKKLLSLNAPGTRNLVEVVLLSANSPEAGARVMHSVEHYGLDIEQAFFTNGSDRFKIAKAAQVQLFLSTNPAEVAKSLEAGVASACVQPHSKLSQSGGRIKIAFDGDSVLFSDEAEKINQQDGLKAFQDSERSRSKIPLEAGPFKPVLDALHAIQAGFTEADCPLRIALVTARGVPAHRRVLKTFESWGVHVHEAYFCAGAAKGPFLEAFEADLFFDDGMHHIASAANYVPAGHVPFGVVNQKAA